MARLNDATCDRCGVQVGTLELPVLLDVGASVFGRGPAPLFAPGALPAHVEALLSLPIPRTEYCLACYLEAHLVHPREVERLLRMAMREQMDLELPNERKAQEIAHKTPRLVEQARARYLAAVQAAATELGLIPTTQTP